MLKKIACVIFALSMTLGFTACSTETAKESADASVENPVAVSDAGETSAEEAEFVFPEMTIVFQGYNAAETDAVCIEEMKEYIEEATDGKVKLDLNDMGALYTQDEAPQAVMAGNLDMSADTIGNLGDYAPELRMFMSPYLFESFDHWKAWFSSDAWAKEVDKIAAEEGMRILGMWNMGADMATLRVDRKVTSRADLADLKMRMPNNSAQLFMGEALGGNVIGLAYNDVYLALQTGTVDGLVSTYAHIKDKCFYEVTKSITETNHIFGTGYFIINEKLWQSMPAELQQILQDAVTTCCNSRTEVIQENSAVLKAFLIEQGMSIYELTDEEMANYQEEVKNYVFSSAGDDFRSSWDMDLYDAVQALAG